MQLYNTTIAICIGSSTFRLQDEYEELLKYAVVVPKIDVDDLPRVLADSKRALTREIGSPAMDTASSASEGGVHLYSHNTYSLGFSLHYYLNLNGTFYVLLTLNTLHLMFILGVCFVTSPVGKCVGVCDTE